MAKNKLGFTIVEVTITIVVIGLLISIGIFGYTKIQAESRDSQRTSRLGVLTEALEKYFAKNGEYPGCNAMTQSADTIASSVLPGLDKTALVAPKAPSGTTNSITCAAIVGASGPDVFAYVGDGSSACTSGAACLSYTLQYREENTGGTIKSIDSRHKTLATTSGTPVLTAAAASSTSIALSWAAVDNASSYQLQRATNSGFTTGLNTSSQAGTSATASGLTNGTTYYFRVAAVGASGQGDWSNTATAVPTTPVSAPSSTPTVSATITSGNAVGTATTVSCTTGTAQYQLRQRNTSTSTDGVWSDWNTWSTTRTLTVSPALEGWEYDFQAQARCLSGSTASSVTPVSNTGTTVRTIAAPTAPTYLSPSSFQSGVSVPVLYATYCPYGTNVDNGYFNSRAWTGTNYGPYPFGTLDYWNNFSGSNKNVEYWGYYQCKTPYSTSPLSSGSYNVVTVTP